MLSMHSDESYVLRAMKAGVHGYLLKESAEIDLLQAIRAVTQGQAFFSPAVSRMLAEDYVQAHARKVEEVMTADPVTIAESTPLEEVVSIMERRRIKRVPVVRGKAVVGIVSRANLMHALASLGRAAPAAANSDTAIRDQILKELDKQVWAPVALIDVVVRDGVVELWGTITEEKQGVGLKVVAENIPGVKKVVNHLTWIEPMSGMILSSPDEDARAGTKH